MILEKIRAVNNALILLNLRKKSIQMGKIKLIYETEDGIEQILSEDYLKCTGDYSLDEIEGKVEDFRKKSLPKATAKLLLENQKEYIKKSLKK